MKLPAKFISSSEDETTEIAEKFSKILMPGDIVEVNGNLGSGKTFFIDKVCKQLGIQKTSSPTFSIVNEYFGRLKVYHFDFYRIENESEFVNIGFFEYLNDFNSITFIEWGNKYCDLLPKKRFLISIKYLDNDKREIQIGNTE